MIWIQVQVVSIKKDHVIAERLRMYESNKFYFKFQRH